MALFTSFNRKQTLIEQNSDTERLVVDLARFIVGQTPLGKAPWQGDFFAEALLKFGSFEVPSAGYELILENGTLASLTLTLAKFRGTLLLGGESVDLGPKTLRKEVTALFGAPYWTDHDDDEVLLFYEYQNGTIELQCEFPDGEHLGYLTLVRDGILSRAGQRESYGVTKAWPPSGEA